MKLFFLAALIGLAAASPKIESSLQSKLSSGQVADVFVTFAGGNAKVVQEIENLNFKTRAHRTSALKQSLEQLAANTQANVRSLLEKHSTTFKSFWITNQIYVKGADMTIVNLLASFPEVTEVAEEIHFAKHQPVQRGPVVQGKNQNENEWGIEKISAPAAWNITNGAGVTVANIDGGVHRSHEALRDRYKDDGKSWFDPRDRTTVPWDEEDGHGTHTMGSITGSHGIGVAPGASWIACKGCGLVSCPQADLLACGEFMVCPHSPDGSSPDCSKAPHLVSNSWGGGQGSTAYEAMTEAWIAAGIVPLFSQGNSGSRCGSANSPGDLRRVIGVGATNIRDEIAYFSSRGPTVGGRLKPEISGPGENIRSSLPTTDSSYGTMSGTSMSCPHAAGVTALALAVNPDLRFGDIRQLVIEAVDTDLTSGGENCGGIPDTQFPNHVFGYGRINALKAVRLAQASLKK